MLTLLGSVAVTVMMLSYWLEPRSRWFLLSFALSSFGYQAGDPPIAWNVLKE